MTDDPTPLFLADDDATDALGRRLAVALRPGDLLLLKGDLGAGKTALARAVIRSLVGDPALEVPSPSFALVQPYDAGGIPVLHADLYRLRDAGEVDELGLFERRDAIVLVEWPERSGEVLERATAAVRMVVPPGGTGRSATVRFADGRPF